jgi:hypothetical protein
LPQGEAVLRQARSTELFAKASLLFRENVSDNPEELFVKALSALQKANKSHSFGLCKTCQYFTKSSEGFTCGLTKEQLSQNDSEKICQEHSIL